MSANFIPTAEQARAISARGNALLIAAGAGSGKTRVLVERLLSRVLDADDPCNIDEFLIITFTRATAAELRDRIYTSLNELAAANPSDRRLRRQTMLARRADIGTIHSFCARIIRENAHLLGVPPDFRVADESEAAVLRENVAARVLESWYETVPQGFSEFADAFSPRGDRRLTEILLSSYEKLTSHRDPDGWMSRHLAQALPCSDFDASDSPWGSYILAEALSIAAYARDLAATTVNELRGSDYDERYAACFENAITQAGAFILAAQRGWDGALGAAKFSFPNLPKVNGGAPDFVKIAWGKVRADLRGAAALFDCGSSEIADDLHAVHPALNALFDLTRGFRDAYSAEKLRRRILDYADLEHYSAELLTDADGGATAFARELSRYREVMVDEYQDVSALQDVLLQAISDNRRRLVMVGDARQSIYRFRLADPTVFIEKYDAFGRGDGGERVILASNFRSRATVLQAVNDVFARIMSRSVGEMDYTEREFLTAGRRDADGGSPVELRIIDMKNSGDDENDETQSGKDAEAAFTARRIRELIDSGFEIPDENGARPVTYNDIVILLRAMSGTAGTFRDALAAQGIPVVAPEPDAFFERKEIELAMAFLAIIDNPRQDVPLVAALTSQAYGFTPDELAAVKTSLPDGEFYDALRVNAAQNDRAQSFLDDLDAFRTVAPEASADEMLWRVYDATDLLAHVASWENGAHRRTSLIKLAELACEFENTGRRGSYGFLRYAERLRERGFTVSDELSGNGVRIMSIHMSKGLEFPVVILPYLGKRINTADRSKPVLLHPELGAGLKRVDQDRRIEYATLPRRAIELRLQRESLSEELRLLYVAMTRAREKLIMTCSFPNALSRLDKLLPYATVPVSPNALYGRSDIASCLLLAALSRPEADAMLNDRVIAPYDGMWDMKIVPAHEISTNKTVADTEQSATAATLLPPPEDLSYPHARASELPSKLTVTELRGRYRDTEVSEDAERPAVPDSVPRRPRFVAETSAPTGAERGNAAHLALRLLDFSCCETLDGVAEELTRLVSAGLLTAEERDMIDARKIAAFFASETGKAAMKADALGKTYREFKFSLLRNASELYDGASDGEILFQGVTDLAFEDGGALTIVDFKSDRVIGDGAIREKTAQYAYQIREYADAMRRVTGLNVARGIIFFLDAGICSEVEL